ncbi:di-heme oxidoreductase family protein [Oceanisphaera arctica]|uniref:Thiol oxidoreductase n=1 Tax=Oceanisphaera arctica TaxID=641510 RepID=A0A2P5TJS3_9GAMM|nr:di-heme oxidoredictase family protein [Oceanisphaera arctica]PPL15268.1 thiol oxidoreductase [Oceanisphaera arctica]GHA14845.1 thiol oxidoreductase [Oceanisphaera arctica]
MLFRLGSLLLGATLALNAQANPAKPGGATTTDKTGANAYSMPATNLSFEKRLDFSVGNSFFRNPWVTAPATTDARDGLGPLFNTNACQSCHVKDGRGHPPQFADDNAVSMLVRLSIPTDGSPAQQERLRVHGVINEPIYGGQLQDMAIPGARPEGKVQLDYQTHNVTLSDGTRVELRQPQLTVTDLGYGELHPDTLFSSRIAPPMIGLGLLEAIDETDLLVREDPQDSNGDGISGRANRVWDIAAENTVVGRFGWKAGQPNLRQQNAGAFAGDMGLSSALFPADDCTPAQGCGRYPDGGALEVSDAIMDSVTFYSQHLAVPARRNLNDPDVMAGQQLFLALGCSGCHTPSWTTGEHQSPALSHQKIYPYTDLLLHDMGERLADNRPEFEASGREWRTPPLWGLGYASEVAGSQAHYLHDGRARTLLEAVLWHGGEAEAAKQSVIAMSTEERARLIAFLESL